MDVGKGLSIQKSFALLNVFQQILPQKQLLEKKTSDMPGLVVSSLGAYLWCEPYLNPQ